MAWGRPRPPHVDSGPPAQMERIKLAEVWTDGEGFMAVGLKDGGYQFFVDPDIVVRGGKTLTEMPFMRSRINLAVLSITKAIMEGK